MSQLRYIAVLFLIFGGSLLSASPRVLADSLDGQKSESAIAPENWVSIDIEIPNDVPPVNAIGSQSRGTIRFSLPDKSDNPNSTIGGGSRGAVRFRPSGDIGSPRSTIGASTRGGVQFSLPDDKGNPDLTVGGGSRGAVQFGLPDDAENPSSTIGGGSRDALIQTPLTALLPDTNNGRTASSHPTIFVYLPPMGTEEIFFSLQDQDGNFLYDTFIPGVPNGGVVAVSIPANAPPLVVDKPYLWYFAPIEPGGRLLPNNYAVTGWVKRVDAQLSPQDMAETAPIKRAIAYAEQGLWYDTLKILADALVENPDNGEIHTEWHDLLQQIDLEVLSTQSIIKSS
ncbi:MAG: DUF928 domain-containing protein [Limnothrix sp. RL_2_0]|nr:DUF928 domain-containing protein [Limnothrix sp. RL_2_0]